MRLTIEAKGVTFALILERDTPPEPVQHHPRGDVFAQTERAESFDFDHSPVGFITSKGTKR